MTALSRYRKLECTGLWRETPGGPRREVVVALGEATLVISDGEGRALSAWSLAALEEAAPGESPAHFRPAGAPGETLEIDDAEMIGALRQVIGAIRRAGRRTGRRRHAALAALGLAGMLAAALWLPGALERYMQQAVPASMRGDLGIRLAGEMAAQTGTPRCAGPGPEGAALAALAAALPEAPASVSVLPGAPARAWVLPGRHVTLGGGLVADGGKDEALEAAAAALRRARSGRPFDAFVGGLGPAGIIRWMATGDVPGGVLSAHASALLAAPAAPGGGGDGVATLADEDWLALRAACGV